MVNALNDMANLAIKGHATRGKEVIEILEMLGGKNETHIKATVLNAFYYINEDGKMYLADKYSDMSNFVIYTLEEFLEKYPYKVGDKVSSKYLKNYKIEKMEWEDINNRVIYKLEGMGWYCAYELQPYKAEIMEKEISGAIVDRFICLEGYDFYDDKGNIINTNEITMKKKQPKYPNTFVECAKILDCFCAAHIDGYYCRLLEDLQALLICRDAYWKIESERMKLGKPWEPDWSNDLSKYYISFYNNKVDKGVISYSNKILAFPTEEMRDAFYENFKELIEECKELL